MSKNSQGSKILDLHGMTLQRAYQETIGFLTAHRDLGTRKVLVICGKGDKISREIVHWCLSVTGVSSCTAVADSTGEVGSYRVTFFKKKAGKIA